MSSIVAESKESSHPRPHVIDIQLRKENLEKYTFLTEIVIISDYDSSSRRLLKGFLIDFDATYLLFDSEEMPRTLYVMSYSALLVKDDIQKYCRLLIHMKSIKPFHYADLEPLQLGAAITNQICFSLMKRGWMAFALEDQTEGVMLQYDVSSPSLSFQNTKAFAVRNVVVTHEDLKAVVTVDVFVYKIKAFSGTDKNDQDHIFLPTNKIVKLKQTKSADGHNYPLLTKDIANQKRGYSLFLPSTNAECIQYYLNLYGTQLNIEKGNFLHFVEVQEDDGYSSIVPSCLLANCCTEMQLHSIYQSKDLIGDIVQCIGFANLRLFSQLKLENDSVDTTESELRQTFRSAALIQLHAVCDDTSVHSNLLPDTDRLEMERSVYGNSNCGQESNTSNALNDLLKASLSTEAGNSEDNFRAENRKPLASYTVSRDSIFRSVGVSATDTHQISGTKQTLNSIPVPVCTNETVSPDDDINSNLTMPKHVTKQKRSTVEVKCVPIDTSVEDVSQRDLRRKKGARNLSREPSFHYEKSAATNSKQNTRTRKKCKQVTTVVQAKGLEHKNGASIISSNHVNASLVYPRGYKTECGLKDGSTTSANYATRGSIQKPKSSLQQKNGLEDLLVDNSTYKIGDTSVDRQVDYKATNSPTEAVRSEPLHLEREASDDFMDILFLN